MLFINSVKIKYGLCTLLSLIVACPFASFGQETDPHGKILVISSYSPDASTISRFLGELEGSLDRHGMNYDIQIENMRCNGMDDAHLWKEEMMHIIKRCDTTEFNALVIIGKEAWVTFLQQDSLNIDIPVYSYMASDNGIVLPDIVPYSPDMSVEYVNTKELAENLELCGGFLNCYDVETNIELILNLYPETRTIALLTDNSCGGVSLREHVKKVMKDSYEGTTLVMLDGSRYSPAQIREAIVGLPQNSALLLGMWRIRNSGSYMSQGNLGEIIPRSVSVPCFSLTGLGIGEVAIGGYIPKYDYHVDYITNSLHDLENGDAQKLNFYDTGEVYRFSKSMLKFYGIDENSLPDKSIVERFDQERFRRIRHIATLSVGAILFLIVLVIMQYVARRRLKSKQKELIAAKLKAQESERLKSAFLANMSHEIRTPMNAIVGFSDLLLTTEDAEEKAAYCRLIKDNNNMLLNLINDILDLSKIEAGHMDLQPSEFDVAVLFDELSKAFALQMRDGVELRYVAPYKNCFVSLDRKRLMQIITNFVTNSIKFTPKGSITMGYKYDKGNLKVFVTDTGVGISDEHKSKIFKRFEKLDTFTQGTGLGLSICASLIDAQHGTIGFESQVDKGSSFWAMIPCEAKIDIAEKTLMTNKTMEERVEAVDESKELRILVAEDNDSNFMLVKAILKNYDVKRAINGSVAVDMCRDEKFDLILMDIKMPKMDGIEATKAIREFDKTIPIIALTAYAFDSDKDLAMKAGCTGFVTKPISRSLIITMIDNMLKNK